MMRKLLLFAAVLLVSLGVSGVAMTVDEALALYVGSDLNVTYDDAGKALTEEALAAFREALGVTDALDETDEGAVMDFAVDASLMNVIIALSHTYYVYADAFLGEEESVVKPFYQRGKHWGLKALRMDETFASTEDADGFVAAVQTSDNMEALYWTSSNWLRAGQFDPLAAVFAGMPAKTEALTLRAMELDESYTHFGGYRAFGAFWTGLPSLPAGEYRKNWNKALGFFCKIVDEPGICDACTECEDYGDVPATVNEYLENRMFFVEFYLMPKELWEDAKRIVDSVIADGLGDKYPLYNAISLEKAATVLEEIESHL